MKISKGTPKNLDIIQDGAGDLWLLQANLYYCVTNPNYKRGRKMIPSVPIGKAVEGKEFGILGNLKDIGNYLYDVFEMAEEMEQAEHSGMDFTILDDTPTPVTGVPASDYFDSRRILEILKEIEKEKARTEELKKEKAAKSIAPPTFPSLEEYLGEEKFK